MRTLPAAMSLKIFLTSPMVIDAGDVVVDAAAIGSPQVRLTLCFLVTKRRQAVPRTQLADVLWPEGLPPSWEGALRGVVSKVRTALAAAGLPSAKVLTSAFGCYQLHLPSDTVVDIELIATAVAAAEEALAQGHADDACEYALMARRLAERPFLPEEDEEWVEQQRAELRNLLLRTLDAAADAFVVGGRVREAAEAAEASIALDRFHEPAYRRLMSAHAVGGSRGEALRAYERCRRVLAEELGVRPAAETEAAYLSLLGEEPEARTDAPLAVPRLALPPPPSGLSRRLVDREAEGKALAEAWDQVRAGCRQVVVVEGEAGMGKTSLVLGFAAEAAEERATVLYGRCDREVWTPYQPFVEALGRYVEATPAEELQSQAGWGAPELAGLLPQLAARLPEIRPAGALDPETERHRLFVAVASFLSAIAASAPTVLVVDDFQWAGPGAVLLLRHLVRALADAPVLVVLAHRAEELGSNPALAAALADLSREEGVARLHLGGLDQAAVGKLVHQALGAEPGASVCELAGQLRIRTGGNPFFLTELLVQLRHDHLAADVETLLSAVSGCDLVVPGRVRDLIWLRRAGLSQFANRVLEVASVVGVEFSLEVLERAGGAQTEVLLDALDEARAAGLVREVAGTVGRYRFAQGLVADAIRDTLGATRRARLHARVAEALEDEPAAHRSPAAIAELAHHLLAARPFVPAAKALDATLAAADSALGHLAYEQAATLYERALRVGLDHPGEQGRRGEVLVTLAGAQRKAGRVTAARASYLEAVAVARSLGDPVSLAECALGLGGGGAGVSAWIADEVRIGLLEEALGGLGDDQHELRARVLAELAKALHFSSDRGRRDRLATEATLTAGRVDSAEALAASLSATRVLRWGPANTELRLACAEEMLDLGERAADAELVLRALLGRLPDLVEMGERALLDDELARAGALATELRQPYYLWRARAWEATVAVIDGRVVDAERAAGTAMAVWRGEVHPDARAWSVVHLAVLRLLQRRAGQAAGAVRELAAAYPMVSTYRCLAALVAAQDGRREEAWAAFSRFAHDGFTSPPVDSQWLFGVAALAETCALLDDATPAEALFELLVPFADRLVVLDAFGGGGGFLGPVAHHLGLLAATLGRMGEAETYFDAAVEVAARFGASAWVAWAEAARERLFVGAMVRIEQ